MSPSVKFNLLQCTYPYVRPSPASACSSAIQFVRMLLICEARVWRSESWWLGATSCRWCTILGICHDSRSTTGACLNDFSSSHHLRLPLLACGCLHALRVQSFLACIVVAHWERPCSHSLSPHEQSIIWTPNFPNVTEVLFNSGDSASFGSSIISFISNSSVEDCLKTSFAPLPTSSPGSTHPSTSLECHLSPSTSSSSSIPSQHAATPALDIVEITGLVAGIAVGAVALTIIACPRKRHSSQGKVHRNLSRIVD